jgi:hypothetical protein
MIIILGLIILVAAVIVGAAGVLGNGGGTHELSHGFAVFGYHVTGSSGTLFLSDMVRAVNTRAEPPGRGTARTSRPRGGAHAARSSRAANRRRQPGTRPSDRSRPRAPTHSEHAR